MNVAFNTFQPYVNQSIRDTRSSNRKQSIESIVSKLFHDFRDNVWGFTNYSVQVVRRSIQISARVIPRFEDKMLRVFSSLGLISGISALLTLSKYPESVNSFSKNLSLQDIEGAVLSGCSLIINPLDMLDSAITFSNSLAAIGVVPVVTVFSTLGLPIALTLLGYATTKGLYDSIQLSCHLNQLPSKASSESIPKLLNILENKLTVTNSERKAIEKRYVKDPERAKRRIEILQDKKINKLTRQTDQKVVAKMSEMLDEIRNGPGNLNALNSTLFQTRTLMKRKLVVLCIGNLSSFSLWATLASTYVFQVSAVALPALVLSRNAFLLGKLVYMQEFYHKGI